MDLVKFSCEDPAEIFGLRPSEDIPGKTRTRQNATHAYGTPIPQRPACPMAGMSAKILCVSQPCEAYHAGALAHTTGKVQCACAYLIEEGLCTTKNMTSSSTYTSPADEQPASACTIVSSTAQKPSRHMAPAHFYKPPATRRWPKQAALCQRRSSVDARRRLLTLDRQSWRGPSYHICQYSYTTSPVKPQQNAAACTFLCTPACRW